jgi:hypothetical protein
MARVFDEIYGIAIGTSFASRSRLAAAGISPSSPGVFIGRMREGCEFVAVGNLKSPEAALG